MKKGFFWFASIIVILSGISLISADSVSDSLHLSIQVTDASGNPLPGTYNFVFNISTSSDCNVSNVLYSNAAIIATDSRGVVSYYLPNITLPFNQQYWVCYYRDGDLIESDKFSKSPYAFRAEYINLSGVVPDANFNFTGYNISTTGTGFFSFLGTLSNPVIDLFVQNIFTSNNITAAYFLGNGKYLSGITATASPAGGNTAVQFNDNGATGGNESAFWFNKFSSAVGINGSLLINGVNWSQSKGAIISSGCVANGCYVQYADGTMIEWNTLSYTNTTNTAAGSVFITSSAITVNFPVPFANTPVVSPSSAGSATTQTWAGAEFISTTGFVASLIGTTNTQSGSLSWTAYGRWTNLNLGSGSGGGNGIVNTITNANGTCTQWANGIMECITPETAQITTSTVTGNVYGTTAGNINNNPYLWTYPVPFVSTPSVSAPSAKDITSPSIGISAAVVNNQTTTTAQLYILTTGGSNTYNVSAIAVGRWTNTTNINTPDVSTWGLDSNGNIIQVNASRNVNITGVLYVNGSYVGSFPSGAIVAFNAPVCPTGWALADGTGGTPDLRGIFLRGSGTNGVLTEANGSTFSAIYGAYHNDSLQGHWHNIYYGSTAAGGGANAVLVGAPGNVYNPSPNSAISDGTNGNPRTGAETTPAYYATIYCVKTGSDSGTSTSIWGTVGNTVVLNNASNSVNIATNLTVNGTNIVMYKEVAYTPNITGFGTPTDVNFTWLRIGNHIKVFGVFTAGTSTAAEARISLPNNLTSDGALIPTRRLCGYYFFNVVSPTSGTVLIEPNVNYVTLGLQSATAAGLTKQNGNDIITSPQGADFVFEVPIQGWNT